MQGQVSGKNNQTHISVISGSLGMLKMTKTLYTISQHIHVHATFFRVAHCWQAKEQDKKSLFGHVDIMPSNIQLTGGNVDN